MDLGTQLPTNPNLCHPTNPQHPQTPASDPDGAHHVRAVLEILRQGVRHPMQCWIAHLGQLRGKLRLRLAEPRNYRDGTAVPKQEKMRKIGAS